MEKTNTLDSKIKKYSALALGIAGATAASAQVVYTDVNPDLVLTVGGTSQGTVDFNNDANPELGFGVFQTVGATGTYASLPYTLSSDGGAVIGTSSKSWMGSATGTSSSARFVPVGLANGDAIGGSGSFSSGQGTLGIKGNIQFNGQNIPINDGDFLGTQAYLGAKFDVAGATHYGWVRVEMSADGTTLTIKDYAYDATAGTAINAGDAGGASSASINDISSEVVVRTVNNNLSIELDNASNADVAVVNLAGQKVINEQMNNSYKVINLDEMTTGIYLVNVTTEAGTTTQKIYVK